MRTIGATTGFNDLHRVDVKVFRASPDTIGNFRLILRGQFAGRAYYGPTRPDGLHVLFLKRGVACRAEWSKCRNCQAQRSKTWISSFEPKEAKPNMSTLRTRSAPLGRLIESERIHA